MITVNPGWLLRNENVSCQEVSLRKNRPLRLPVRECFNCRDFAAIVLRRTYGHVVPARLSVTSLLSHFLVRAILQLGTGVGHEARRLRIAGRSTELVSQPCWPASPSSGCSFPSLLTLERIRPGIIFSTDSFRILPRSQSAPRFSEQLRFPC